MTCPETQQKDVILSPYSAVELTDDNLINESICELLKYSTRSNCHVTCHVACHVACHVSFAVVVTVRMPRNSTATSLHDHFRTSVSHRVTQPYSKLIFFKSYVAQ